MWRRLKRIVGSLETRLLLLPASIIIAVVLVQAVVSARATRESVNGFVRAELERSSSLIRGATHDGMLLNRLDEVQTTIEQLTAARDVTAIRVYDKQGAIVLSGARAERGHLVDAHSDVCRSCHDAPAARSRAVLQLHPPPDQADASGVLRHLSIIRNEPACASAGCHAAPDVQPVLGVLEVGMSMAALHESLGATNRRLVWSTAGLVVFGGFAVGIALRRQVIRPILALHAGTRRVARGDLETRIDVNGRHELALLADAFNGMMTDLGQARERELDWSARLEEKVAEKTAALEKAQRQVLHMEKMASLGKLSATVAHELNNPLGGMLTYARLIKRELAEPPLDDERRRDVQHYVDLIDRECARCGTIVHDLLTFARQTGGAMRAVDVGEIIGRSLDLVHHHLEMSSVTLVREGLDGAESIVADGGQIQQALVALLVNAVEAMRDTPESERRITLALRGDDDEVEITVADRGIGIAPDVLRRVFEPFYSTKDGGGTGLGLAVVYGIVNRHGGSIDVESKPGEGTAFRVRLPRRPPPPEDAAARSDFREEVESWPTARRAS